MKLPHYIFMVFIVILLGCNRNYKDNINEKASVSALDELPENPLLLSPITFSINPGEATMSTLYGNTIALRHAMSKSNSFYPNGAVLYEVTWNQKADSLWYGANIPNQIIQVERLTFAKDSLPKYELYAGHPLKKVPFENANKRIAFVISQRMANTP
jgi:hypothetical protein